MAYQGIVEVRQVGHEFIDIDDVPHVRVNAEFVLLPGDGRPDESLGFKTFDIPLSEVVNDGT